MSREMRSVRLKAGQLLHVETPLGVVNIRAGLVDFRGRRVDSVAVVPDVRAGENKIIRRGYYNTRLVEFKGVKT